jgi:hypothetical protein
MHALHSRGPCGTTFDFRAGQNAGPDLRFWVWGLRFRVWDVDLGVKGLGFWFWIRSFKAYGLRRGFTFQLGFTEA